MEKNKIIFGTETLIDLSEDTVTEENVLTGNTFHKSTGEIVEGSCDFDVNSAEAISQYY